MEIFAGCEWQRLKWLSWHCNRLACARKLRMGAMEVPAGPRKQSHSALLVIDVQIGLVEWIPEEIKASVLPRIGALVAKARASGRPVIYIQHDGSRGHVLEPGTKGWDLHPSLQPAANELIIRKRESDSFFETTLHEELKKRGVTHLVVAGGMTEYCVDTTCRRATSLGYDVTLTSDAHLTRDNGVLPAASIIAHHNFVLSDFGAGDHVITTKITDDIAF